MHRILFVPTHWLIQPLLAMTTLTVPAISLWTGWSPLPVTPIVDLIDYQIPALVAAVATLRLLAPDSFFPLAATVHSALQAPRILPTVLTTIVRPHGHAFRVTPKGSAARGAGFDRFMVFAPASLILITALGFFANANFNTRMVLSVDQIPLLAFWGIVSMVVLSVVQAAAISGSSGHHDERFEIDMPCVIGARPGQKVVARVNLLSISGASLRVENLDLIGHNLRWLHLDLPGIGSVAARVLAQNDEDLDVIFEVPPGEVRDRLIRLLFTSGLDNSAQVVSAASVTARLLKRILRGRTETDTTRDVRGREALQEPPLWLLQPSGKDMRS